tara:strand:- start:806 stop:991 length:186 start_codon:yes stop_codon:yes gene_type:complete
LFVFDCCDPSAKVEYAMEAISHAGAAVGILTNSGVVLAAEKKILSKVRLFIFYIYTFRVSD